MWGREGDSKKKRSLYEKLYRWMLEPNGKIPSNIVKEKSKEICRYNKMATGKRASGHEEISRQLFK